MKAKRFAIILAALTMLAGTAGMSAYANEAEETEVVVEEAVVSEEEVIEGTETTEEAGEPVAMVGATGYATIDEAIANWANGATLTLLDDVTLSDVIVLKSTEHHILNLGTYTMTAASGKHAIEITCDGRSSASYALTVNADATNPGGITATGKSCIYYKKSGSTKDRPIILINNGVFTGSYSLNLTSNGNTNCPQIWINGGVFNSYVNLTKCMLRVHGGVFHNSINCTGDSSAYREITGGRFKSWQFMTADATTKFWVGSGNGSYNVGLYVDDEGYLVVGGPVITEDDGRFEVHTSEYKWSSYLKYSSAAENGLYYTDFAVAYAKSKNLTILKEISENIKITGNTVFDITSENAAYNGKVTLSNSSYKFTVIGDFEGTVVSGAEQYDVISDTYTEDEITTTIYSLKLITESTEEVVIDETKDTIEVSAKAYVDDKTGGTVNVSLPADAFAESDANKIYLLVEATKPNEASSEFVGVNATVYEIEFVDENGNDVEFKGTAVVEVPYSGTDYENRRVYFISENGYEDMKAVYDVDKKAFVFETTHFSQYAIVDPSLLEEGIAEKVAIMFKATANPNVYDIYAVAIDGQINRFSSTQLKFNIENATTNRTDVVYEITPATNIKMTEPDVDGYVLFNFDGVNAPDSKVASTVHFATVTFDGYGKFTFTTIDTAAKAMLHTAEIVDSVVDDYTVAGNADGKCKLVLSGNGENADNETGAFGDTITTELYVPTKNLSVNIAFPNTVENNVNLYQQMKLTVSGGDLEQALTIDLGTDYVVSALDVYNGRLGKAVVPSFANSAYTVEINNLLTVNTSYVVTVEGAGYRTARYTVTMTDDKVLNFWNNVKDNDTYIEEEKKAVKTTFLAGDIVKDNDINIYDLSAVVSYFGENMNTEAYSTYAKYDLNRDGKIDSKDVAYVLVSWGN